MHVFRVLLLRLRLLRLRLLLLLLLLLLCMLLVACCCCSHINSMLQCSPWSQYRLRSLWSGRLTNKKEDNTQKLKQIVYLRQKNAVIVAAVACCCCSSSYTGHPRLFFIQTAVVVLTYCQSCFERNYCSTRLGCTFAFMRLRPLPILYLSWPVWAFAEPQAGVNG